MPRIEWTGLPRALREHLFERLRERHITIRDPYQLKLWRESQPEALGEGRYPKTFLVRGQPARGKKL